MSWICPKCGVNNVNYNERCANFRCREKRTEISSFDSFDELLSQARYAKIDYLTGLYLSKDWRVKTLTPQEEKFKELYNSYKTSKKINALSDLELRARREKFVDMAYNARVATTAIDDILKERKPKKDSQGFERSVNQDETATNAINTIKERQKRMTKMDKVKEGLMKMGLSAAEAEKSVSAGTILGRLKAKFGVQPVSEEKPVNDSPSNSGSEEKKVLPFSNPFGPKTEDKPLFNNPFGRKE